MTLEPCVFSLPPALLALSRQDLSTDRDCAHLRRTGSAGRRCRLLGTANIHVRTCWFLAREGARGSFEYSRGTEVVMPWKVLTAVFLLAVVVGLLPGNAHAQSQSCMTFVSCHIYSLWNAVCIPALPPGAFDCHPGAPWETICSVITNQCPPAVAAEETCPTCAKGKPTAGAPISLATGNTYIEQADVRIPGLSGGLTLVRTWNSKWPSTQNAFRVGLFGPNWRSNFEERIFVGDDHYTKYSRGDGSFWSFGYNGSTLGLAAPANIAATLTQGDTYWTLTFQNGEQRLFSVASGSLVSIIDRNGNTTQLSYDALNRLTTVADPAGRHLYFAYASPSSLLVTSVTSDFGVSLTYTYDGQSRLTQVTKPDLSTLNFEYDINSLITAVKDSAGRILESHTYDSSGRGLTSTKANGVDAVTITYPNP